MSAMIEVRDLSKQYGGFAALSGVSFQVAAGEIVGFLGPNGAGKTTTMKILTGFLSPSGGEARVAGFDVVSDSLEVRRRIGYLPESAPIYAEMRVVDYLDFIGRVRGMAQAERVTAIERASHECDIVDRLHQPVGTLSKGYRQRVGIADALVAEPEVVLLDEPTIGLDPHQVLGIRDLLRRLRGKLAVLISSHILSEVEQVCDRVVIIHRGRLVAQGRPDDLRRELLPPPALLVGTPAGAEAVGAVARRLDSGARASEDGPGRVRVELPRGSAARDRLLGELAAAGVPVASLAEEPAGLEAVFLAATRREAREAPPA